MTALKRAFEKSTKLLETHNDAGRYRPRTSSGS